jgi:mycofactocin system creatininase family protein
MPARQSNCSSWLADLTSPEVGRRAEAGALLAIPLGSTEQHGAHLPLSTDTDVAVALCGRLAAARGDVVIAPPVAYGSSGEHDGFPGTLSIGLAAVEMVVVELGRSATETFTCLVLVSAHGGNTEAVTKAVRTLQAESRDVLLYLPRWVGDPHAGHQETSMMLDLAPSLVHMDRAVRGDARPIAETWPLLRSGGVRAVTDTGVLGDPTKANPDDGRDLLDALGARLIDEVAAWHPVVTA